MLPPPTIYWQNSQIQLPLFTCLSDPFCSACRCQDWKRTCCRGTHQPHSQVYPLHVCTNCGSGGWWVLPATFNLTLVYMLDAPQLNMKGLHVGRNLSLYWRGSRAGGFQCLLCRNRGFRFHGFLRGQMGNGGGGGAASFLGRRWRCG